MPRNKKIKRNVRRVEKKSTFSWASFFQSVKKIIVSGFVVLLIGGAGYSVANMIGNVMQKPIAQISIQGELRFVKKNDVHASMHTAIEKSFISENLQVMRKKVMENPWVDSVSLRRRWPDTLVVDVVEQRPIARWGNKGFVNFRGELVVTDDNDRLSHLPLLHGNEKETVQVMKQYQLLSQMLVQQNKQIVELEKDALGIWTLHLDNGWKLVAGRTDVPKKIQRFLHVLSQNKIGNQENIQVIDMRYENGIAVKWKEYEQHALTQVDPHKGKI
jgi:cell division protein FtsQ